MADYQTFKAYSRFARNYNEDWLAQPQPSVMYSLLKTHFIPGGRTLDVGCGNGRDAFWLSAQGFKVEGVDSSSELIQIAQENFPGIKFTTSALPVLCEVQGLFDNVLCETVIMHLPLSEIGVSVKRLKALVKNIGILYLSWRVTEQNDARHQDGRLYSAFAPEQILGEFNKKSVLHFEDKISLSSGKRVCRLVARATD